MPPRTPRRARACPPTEGWRPPHATARPSPKGSLSTSPPPVPLPPSPLPPSPRRRVVHAEALAWLEENGAEPHSSVITSLPDLSEVAEMGFDRWRTWFVGAARRVL